jgi:hypothetical protein
MKESKLITFFKEASSYTKFERIKYIYELTNNLDLDLLFDLKDEFIMFGLALKTKAQFQEDKNFITPILTKEDFKFENRNNIFTYMKIHLKDYEAESHDFVKEEFNSFIEEIDDLIKRKLSDLPKNSRHKNNLNYEQFVEIEPDDIDVYAHLGGDEFENNNIYELIDLSDTSLVEKIIYLEKLGIIEFLRGQKPFNTSVNSIANVFSAITGAKSTSIQPLLNPLINRDFYNKNNPMNSTKTVYSVDNKLGNLGFQLNKNK